MTDTYRSAVEAGWSGDSRGALLPVMMAQTDGSALYVRTHRRQQRGN